MTAATFGIALHLVSVHKAVAVLALFYLAVAVVPWIPSCSHSDVTRQD